MNPCTPKMNPNASQWVSVGHVTHGVSGGIWALEMRYMKEYRENMLLNGISISNSSNPPFQRESVFFSIEIPGRIQGESPDCQDHPPPLSFFRGTPKLYIKKEGEGEWGDVQFFFFLLQKCFY